MDHTTSVKIGTPTLPASGLEALARAGDGFEASRLRVTCGATVLDPYLRRSSAGPLVLVAEATENRWADVPSGLDPLPITHRVRDHCSGIGVTLPSKPCRGRIAAMPRYGFSKALRGWLTAETSPTRVGQTRSQGLMAAVNLSRLRAL